MSATSRNFVSWGCLFAVIAACSLDPAPPSGTLPSPHKRSVQARGFDFAPWRPARSPRPSPTQRPVPTPAPAKAVVVAVAGDIGCDPDDAYYYNDGQGRPNACRQKFTADVVAAIGPDVVLTTGDHVYPGGAYRGFMEVYDKTWGRFKAITRPSVGDHDMAAGDNGYFRYFGAAAGDPAKGYYSFDMGAWHFVALNSFCEGAGGCGSGAPQTRWLLADLASNRGKRILAYWHAPRFSSGVHSSDPQYAPWWQALLAANASLVVNGHDHVYERFAPQDAGGKATPGGIRQFISGLGGYLIYGWSTTKANSQVRYNATFGVLRLSLYPDAYDWEFIPEDGSTYRDTGRQALSGATPRPTATPAPRPRLRFF